MIQAIAIQKMKLTSSNGHVGETFVETFCQIDGGVVANQQTRAGESVVSR
jgi:hypothetical protein